MVPRSASIGAGPGAVCRAEQVSGAIRDPSTTSPFTAAG
ncbi:hypothetical protein FHR81_001842 [Actinoalloteichus hoggarensis]|uniref:Uncharacterized protein n=1 Tax=Actinoalloteichus hoggarensis TaxID=1470176 RepID=A0A221W558_9PSEU|nr:hypothetical protein AHOG_16235 [Actinoalloteichus hoggarensis]MBB5920804.1 hypothetical protein [Actinoalloteichus hoggarensis]